MKTNQNKNIMENKELIPISEHNGKKAVSARLLHAFLESKQEFSNWIKNRIQKYDLVENQDYVSFDKIVERGVGATTRIEYALSLECAKELAMVEGNAKGKQARLYFIACEQRLKEVAKSLSTLDLLELTIKGMRENQQELAEVKKEVLELKAKTQTRPDFFTIVGYGTLNHIPVNLKQAATLGRKAAALCKARGIETDRIPDPRFGEVKMYPATVLDEVFEQSLTLKGCVA
jgi:phage anti-repressor protein